MDEIYEGIDGIYRIDIRLNWIKRKDKRIKNREQGVIQIIKISLQINRM